MRTRTPVRLGAVLTIVALSLAGAAALGTAPAEAAAPYSHVANDTTWHHGANAEEIKAQGGNIFKDGEHWYWVGTGMDPRGSGAAKPKSINLYRSADLESWSFVKSLVTQSGTTGDLAVGGWLGRPKLVHNPLTGQYIIWVEVGAHLGNAQAVFTSATVDGVYTRHTWSDANGNATAKLFVNGLTTGDRSVFVEGDEAYLVYIGDSATSRNQSIGIARLTDDWLNVEEIIWSTWEGTQEAPSIVKVSGTYYLFASGKNWWSGTPTSYRTSTDLTNWTGWKAVGNEPSSATSFGSQFVQILPVIGTQGTSYLFIGDRYSQYFGYVSSPVTAPGGIGRNVFYPLTFANGVPTLHGATDVDVDAAAGTLDWNEVANGRFDQHEAKSAIAQWSSTGTAGAVRTRESDPDHPDRFLEISSGAAFNAWAYQDIVLPNGTYELSFDHKSSGHANTAFFSLKNHGSSEVKVDLKPEAESWTTRTVSFTVTTGKARIGVWIDGPASGWLNLEDISVWRR
jgi:hypothetical protein